MCGPRTHCVAVPGLDEGKIGESAQGEGFSVSPDLEWTSRGGTSVRTHSDLERTALGFHICEHGSWKSGIWRADVNAGEKLQIVFKISVKCQASASAAKPAKRPDGSMSDFVLWSFVCSVLLLLFSKSSAITLRNKIHSSKLGYSTIYKSNTIAFYMKLQLHRSYIKECQKEGGSVESYLYIEKETFFGKSL